MQSTPQIQENRSPRIARTTIFLIYRTDVNLSCDGEPKPHHRNLD
ncbi:MAG: hypothetical protein ACKPCM_09175 [Pseudanabaena sp.]